MEIQKKRRVITEYLKVILLIAGCWRLPLNNSKFVKSCYFIYSVIVQMSFLGTVLLLICNIPFIVKTNDYGKVVEFVSLFLVAFIMQIKLATCQTDQVTNMIKQCQLEQENTYKEEPEEIQDIVDNSVKVLNLVISIVVINNTFAVVVFLLGGFSTYMEYKDYNATIEKPLILPLWYPFDENYYYGAAVSLGSYFCTIGGSFATVVQVLFFTVMTHVAIQLKTLQMLARRFYVYREIDYSDYESVDEEPVLRILRRIYRKHISIIGFVEQFNNSVRHVMLLEFALNALTIAAHIVRILLMDDPFLVKVFVIVLCNLQVGQLFLTAWHANEIQIQSLALSDALFQSQWYNQSENAKRIIHIMMMRARKPLSIFIGPFFPMKLETALNTMKAVYSYVTLFMAMASAKQLSTAAID